jgi:hypothetical protein
VIDILDDHARCFAIDSTAARRFTAAAAGRAMEAAFTEHVAVSQISVRGAQRARDSLRRQHGGHGTYVLDCGVRPTAPTRASQDAKSGASR